MNRHLRIALLLITGGCMSLTGQVCRLRKPGKQVTIHGDIASPLKSGSIELTYKEGGKRISRRQKIVRTKSSYVFNDIPCHARSVRIKRYYLDGGQCKPAQGRFRIPDQQNCLELTKLGNKIVYPSIELPYNPNPNLRQAMVWRWA